MISILVSEINTKMVGTLFGSRGFHFQKNKQQAMLVSVLKGKINDYCVDLRKNSKGFKKIYKNSIYPGKLLYVPKGFAHAFYSYEKVNTIYYKLSKIL